MIRVALVEDDAGYRSQLEEYLVSFRIANIRSTSGDLFEAGPSWMV